MQKYITNQMEKLVFKFLDDYLGNEFGVTEMVLYDPYNFTPKMTINVLSKKQNDICILMISPSMSGFVFSIKRSKPMDVISDFFSLNQLQSSFLIKKWFLIRLGIPCDNFTDVKGGDITSAVVKLYNLCNKKLDQFNEYFY
jgi:hypothetical protein